MKNKQEILDVLQNHFGFDDFRPGQEETINALLEGKIGRASCRERV